ncbi:hypothetical protein E4U57_001458 [Claviceps arundinis]|uniref:Uncharacterized protein n=1 Tax=Claviceps arundinis TaxID=1623583 RepID=A0ABQ7PAM0_9HYPO|nr:hypothetical protein E4U57_001458 [Claviceps arundinis]
MLTSESVLRTTSSSRRIDQSSSFISTETFGALHLRGIAVVCVTTSYPLFLLLRRFWNLFYGCHVLRTVDEDLSFLCFRSTVRKKSCVGSSIALSLPPRQLCFITCSLSM